MCGTCSRILLNLLTCPCCSAEAYHQPISTALPGAVEIEANPEMTDDEGEEPVQEPGVKSLCWRFLNWLSEEEEEEEKEEKEPSYRAEHREQRG